MTIPVLLIVIVALALIFDYINGFHDAANSIATVVSTKVLTPFQAVLWAAVFNFVAYFIFTDHAVANTVGKTVQANFITLPVIFSGLIAAIFWNLLTWWFGIPSSSSHTLIGGFAGAAITHAIITKGTMIDVVDVEKILKTVFFIFLAPIIGMIISAFITLVTIKRNTWIKALIIAMAGMATWFMFDYFRTGKFEENLSKFYKIDKYNKEINKNKSALAKNEKDSNALKRMTENSEKLEKAKKNLSLSLPFVKEYDKNGDSMTAVLIAQKVDLKGLEIDKKRDEIKKLLLFEKIKQDGFYGINNQTPEKAEKLEKEIDACKSIIKKYPTKENDSAAILIGKKLNLSPTQVEKLHKKMKDVHITKTLSKEIHKADNRGLAWGVLILCGVFILVFIYVEKIRKPTAYRMANTFKKLQLVSSAAFSIGHGGNDAQKVMGIIAAAFVANGNYSDIDSALKEMHWVPLACYAAIGLGTLSGGWKIVKTMGSRITKVTPLEGVSAESAGAITLFMTEQMGIPVSTTHTITGSIIGVGATKRLSAVRWGVTRNLLVAWILTIPVSAMIAAITYLIANIWL